MWCKPYSSASVSATLTSRGIHFAGPTLKSSRRKAPVASWLLHWSHLWSAAGRRGWMATLRIA